MRSIHYTRLPTTKLTVRLSTELVELLTARAARQHRGLSNTLESAARRSFRLPPVAADRPYHYDQRYTARPRPPAQ